MSSRIVSFRIIVWFISHVFILPIQMPCGTYFRGALGWGCMLSRKTTVQRVVGDGK